jgi:hypothetical protein
MKHNIINKSNTQYKNIILNNLGNISVLKIFILDDERYIYRVFENKKECWYLLNGDKFLCTNILKKYKRNNTYIYTLTVDYSVSFNLIYNGSMIQLDDNVYHSVIDPYLLDLFYDIYRMNKSN